jgi:D-tagatose-1,6-bisphosphate aldolase subunit GatZ/KbaZ
VSAALLDVLRRHKGGECVGITSVCSAHPLVLRAALAQARDDGGVALLEATSNQVDQFGGYTGMRPPDFRDLVLELAKAEGLPPERVALGGDHLGPNTWRQLSPEPAMERAEDLVVAYVEAGYTKIHLDCSMACAGDPVPLPDEVVARRSARLAAAAERAALDTHGRSELLYVIGTEVPVPGGAHEAIEALTPTSAAAARATLGAHERAFAEAGLDVWDRVIALVVQPGVEFDAEHVVDYDRSRTAELRAVSVESPTLVFEAHSTDYQLPARLVELVEDHWAVLKVGPGLTFALREALFALAAIEDELVAHDQRSDLVDTVERVMVARPKWWQSYYPGDATAQRLARRYSYSDRLRYYWPEPEIVAAQRRLFDNLEAVHIPLPLLSAFLPEQYARVRSGQLAADPTAIAVDRVRDVLRAYSAACFPPSVRSRP